MGVFIGLPFPAYRFKSFGWAIFWTVLLGPLGLFYASSVGALALIAVWISATSVPGFAVLCWPASIVWAVLAVRAQHLRVRKAWGEA